MSLLRDSRGVAALELALAMPFIFLLFIGSFEMARYIQINQKLEKAVHSVADIVAQSESVEAGGLATLVGAMDHIMAPYNFGGNGRVVITSVAKNDPAPALVQWQYCGGGLAAVSSVGGVGDVAQLPAGFTLADKEDIIIAEIFYDFQPVIDQELIGIGQIRKTAIYRPRLGALDDFNGSCG